MTLLLLLLLAAPAVSSESHAASIRPALQLSGRVVDRTGKPIARALIKDNRTLLTRTDAQGRFTLPNPAPEHVAVEAPAFATRTIEVPREASALGDILLQRAARVSVDVSKVRDVRELSLVPYDERRDTSRANTRPVTGRVISFLGLEPGDYLLTARGTQPLQRKSQVLRLGEGAHEEVALTVDRMPLRGYVFLGREPLAHADVEIVGPSSNWQGLVRTEGDGHYETELWQVGAMQAVVTSPKLPTEFATGHRPSAALEEGAVEWNIVVPERQILVRVVDEAGSPVANASASVEADDGDIRSRLNFRTDAHGTFAYGAARTGRYSVEIDSPRHLKPAPLRFELGDEDPNRTVEVTVKRGVELRVRVSREDGTPIADALVADGIVEDGSRPVARYRTTKNGDAAVRGRSGEEKTLYVIPVEGSFAVARVLLDAEAVRDGVEVIVPDAKSALVIRARDAKGAALDGVRFMVRYNGEMLPPPVMTLIRQLQHVDYRTTPAGEARIHGLPSGEYELWAYRTASEAERLVANPSGYPPSLELAVASGTYEADLTFGQ